MRPEFPVNTMIGFIRNYIGLKAKYKVIFTFATMLLLAVGTLQANTVDNDVIVGRIPIVGFIEDAEILSLAKEVEQHYLFYPAGTESGIQRAAAIIAYIGESVVDHGRFVPPEALNIPQQQLELLMSKTFPNEGCRVERLVFSASGDFAVLLVDASTQPTLDYMEQCLLLAALTAHDVDLSGAPLMSSDELIENLRTAVQR